MIKIISGWSGRGGSTTAHINLCNLFNRNGMKCIFYGPQENHIKLCKGDDISEFYVDDDDIIIAHLLVPRLIPRTIDIERELFKAKKKIYSCHEKNIWPIREFNFRIFDVIHYVSEHQKHYHNVDYPNFVCGNALENLKPNRKIDRAAAIIGSIDPNKQTHKSIERAIEDGHKRIYLFGEITDQDYFNSYVYPMINNNIKLMGYFDNKQQMYDMITDVYQDSVFEAWGYVKAECKLTGTIFHGSDATSETIINNNAEILEIWKKHVN